MPADVERSGIVVRKLGGASEDIPTMEVITEVIRLAEGELPREDEVVRLGDGPPRVLVGEGDEMLFLPPDKLLFIVGVDGFEVGVEDRPPDVEGRTGGVEDLGVGVEGLVPVGVEALE